MSRTTGPQSGMVVTAYLSQWSLRDNESEDFQFHDLNGFRKVELAYMQTIGEIYLGVIDQLMKMWSRSHQNFGWGYRFPRLNSAFGTQTRTQRGTSKCVARLRTEAE